MRVHRSLVAVAAGLVILVSPAEAQVVEHRLPNGLQVLLLHDGASQDVEVDLGVFFGLADDTLRGMAHFLEHLAMRETKDGRSLAGRYGTLGISGGAFTNATRSIFGMGMRGGIAALDTLLSMQRQRLTDLALSEVAVSSERNSVHTEIDGPPDRAWMPVLFPHSHLANLARDHVDLDRITPAAMRTFYQKYYAPGNVTLIIASALPDTLVMRRVTAVLGTIPAQRHPVPRPVFRDSTTIMAKRWIGADARGKRVLAVTVPGPQHPWRGLLEAAVRELFRIEDGVTPTVEIRLREELPVSTLEIRVMDSPAANDRLAVVWQHLLEQIGASARLKETPPPRLGVIALVDCEAAGSWRYCLADSPVTPAAQAGLLAAMHSAEGTGKPVVLWPVPMRPRPTDAQVAATAALAPSTSRVIPPRNWRSPDMAPIVYRTTAGGLEWSARSGGIADSVYIAAVLAPSDGNPSAAEITAMEMLARAWGKLRTPSGMRVDSLLRQQGVSLDVRSLPYPVLATTDNFTTLASVLTPLGVYGVELMITAPRARAASLLATIREILATATLDPPFFEALKARQLELLNGNRSSSHLAAERASRGRMVQVPAAAVPRFLPTPYEDQLTRMSLISNDDIIAAARSIAISGAGRIVILGADETEAGSWIEASGLASLKGLHWPGSAPECPPVDTTTRALGLDAANAQTWLYTTICSPAPESSAEAAARIVASRALTGSEAAMVAHRLRSELGLAYATYTRLLQLWDSPKTLWQYEIVTPTKTVDQAIDEIRKLLSAAIANGPSEQLFNDTRTALIELRKQRTEDGISWITSVLWGGISPEQEAELIRGVTLEQVRAEIARGWRPEMMQVVHSAGQSGGSDPN